jgi:hypothetical protein
LVYRSVDWCLDGWLVAGLVCWLDDWLIRQAGSRLIC